MQPSSDALIVVDVQNDFIPKGALAVTGGDQIIPIINQLLGCFSVKVFTRDWHPANHISFSTHPNFIDQSWPAHCVQNTWGAEFHPDLDIRQAQRIISKGIDPKREAYSGFQDSDLATWLQARKVQRVFVSGLATDYCVKNTALDARRAGFEVFLIQDAVRGVNTPPGTEAAAITAMQTEGVQLISSQVLLC